MFVIALLLNRKLRLAGLYITLLFIPWIIADILTQAHVLGFGVLVVLVILVLPNGIVGDWPKIRKRVFRLDAGS